MMRKKVYAAVIGGGAAGLMCALRAAERHPDKDIVILEKADRVGKKLLVTGNGRCNLSHVGANAKSYHGDGCEDLINILFEKYSPDAVIAYFNRLGLMTYSDNEGRVYPISRQASSVLDVLRMRLKGCGAEELCGVEIREIRKVKGGYEIRTDSGIISAERLVIAVGGKVDYAGRESGAGIVKTLSLSTVKCTPSLSPIKVDSEITRSLKGIRATAEVRLIHGVEIVKAERGEVQFTENALSGICIFNLSRFANQNTGCEIGISLLPDLSREEIREELQRRIELNQGGNLSDIFVGLFHKSIGNALMKSAGIKPSTACSDISDKELNVLADTIADWRFKAVPRHDFQNAQVSAGGIKLSEIDARTFETKKHRGLYIIGEALDIDGDCGGYNLQFAFASGMCAGDSL